MVTKVTTQKPSSTFTTGGNVGSGSYNVTGSDLVSARTGNGVPRYRERIKKGISASSSYSADAFRINGLSKGSCSYATKYDNPPLYSVGPSEYAFGTYGAAAPYPVAHRAGSFTKADAESLSLLYKKLASQTSQMNGMQFFGELREAIHMLRRPAEGLIQAFTKHHDILLKKKSFLERRFPTSTKSRSRNLYNRNKKRELYVKAAAQSQLELSFGWQPFINDTKDIAVTIARLIVGNQDIRSRIRSFKDESSASTNSNTSGVLTYVKATVNTKTETSYGVQYIAGLKTRLEGPLSSASQLADVCGFTVANFVPTLYELMPWSFLIDYFSNLGDVIGAACASRQGITYVIRTERLLTNVTINTSLEFLSATAQANGLIWAFDKGSNVGGCSFSRVSITRTPLDELPLVPFIFQLPGRITQFGNMAALLAGARKQQRLL